MLEWLRDLGGVAAMQKINERKAAMLYEFLDNSKMFKGTAVPEYRSLMNIPFTSPTEEIDKRFIKEAAAAGFINLKGHRSVGGMRASIYNAMPEQGVKRLVDFMKDFESRELARLSITSGKEITPCIRSRPSTRSRTFGLEIFPRDEYEIASEIINPDAILVRSANMLAMEIPPIGQGDRPGWRRRQ